MKLYLNVFTKMHTNDVYKDQKRHKDDTIDNATHDESFEAKKSIPRLKQPRYPPECKV